MELVELVWIHPCSVFTLMLEIILGAAILVSTILGNLLVLFAPYRRKKLTNYFRLSLFLWQSLTF